ncbi:hypothetical protein ACFOWX_08515 [Sphingorhabdus arenilitoris]|uniref:Uncharacterized protein n=1 Tax=Sphingorhabdus arenilitoris TaxID=1490041 RepID=A0ABV8RJK2_9SPHN
MPRKLLLRSVVICAAAPALLLSAQLGKAQSQPGWQIVSDENVDSGNIKNIRHSDGDSIVITTYPLEQSFATNPEKSLAQLAQTIPGCGTGEYDTLPESNSHLLVTNGRRTCVFMYSRYGDKAGLVMAFVVGQEIVDVIEVADGALQIAMREQLPAKIASNGVGIADQARQTAQAQPPKQTIPAAPATSGDSSLKASIDRIPAANRPIGMASVEGEYDSYNASITFDNYLLFPGGYAINSTCKGWNPILPPARQTDCSVVRYTAAGRGMVRIGGSMSETNLFEPFSAGERVSYDYGNISGNGGAGYSQTSGSGLKLTRDGQIRLSDWSGTSLSGGNYSGYAGSQGQISGRYYLDGYIIAIQDDEGNISASFIAKKNEGGDRYLYLNGELFWE